MTTQNDANDGPLDQTFDAMLADARAGSDLALNELIRSCQSYLLLIANQELGSMLRGKVGASDVVQSALVLAQQNLDQFRGKSQKELLSWLRTILINEVNAAHRRFTAEKRNVRREVCDGDADRRMETADDGPSPLSTARINEEASALRAAMQKLGEDHRQVILLRTWEQLPFEEVGRQMNRSPEAARKLHDRAMRQLKEILRNELP